MKDMGADMVMVVVIVVFFMVRRRIMMMMVIMTYDDRTGANGDRAMMV